jgi:Uma2 family endonuclease
VAAPPSSRGIGPLHRYVAIPHRYIGSLYRYIETLHRYLAALHRYIATLYQYIGIQSPVTLPPRDEPEPDLAIVKGLPADFALRHPGPAEVTCVIEVAGSSLDRDRTVKQRIYAAAGIPQYVIVNLIDSRLEVFERPDPAKRRYRRRTELAGDAEVSLLLPENRRLVVAASDCLP